MAGAFSSAFSSAFDVGGGGGGYQPAWSVHATEVVRHMRKNVASQIVSAQLVSATDGSAVTSGTTTVYVTGDGGTQGTGGGTVTHEGQGSWSYAPTQAETNYNHIAFTFANSSAVSVTVNVYTISFDPHDTVRLGLTALPNAAADAAGGLPISDAGGLDLDTLIGRLDAAVSTRMATYTQPTGFLAATFPTTVASPTNITGGTITTVSGNVNGSVGSVTGAVGSVTGNVGGSVGSLATQAKADVNAEVDTALVDIHLDHLLAADYDPASKPGVSTALLNELIEDDGAGVSRYTTAALNSTNIVSEIWTGFAPRAVTSVSGSVGGNVVGSVEGNVNGKVLGGGAGTITGLGAWAAGAAGATISTHTAANVRTEIDSNSTQLAAIVADTNELQTDWANGGRLDLLIDAIKAKTDNLPAAPAATGDIPTVSQIWTTALTEAYRSTGATGTATQLLYEILQNLTEFTISGTTKTVKKLDGSTTAKTYTLNDGSNPTGITETT